MEIRKKNIIIAVTGASGAPYARALLAALPSEDVQIYLVASRAGKLVYELEIGVPLEKDVPDHIRFYEESDFTAPFASGSFPIAGMVIVPCTMGTLAAIAQGISHNLIHRAADVCLKERRRLILVPRETPLNGIHLRNMLQVNEAGGIILPPMPGFYHRPRSVEDLVHFVVARILDQLDIPHYLMPPWNPENLL